jgi:DNA-binding NarL/FixJ family response regulator
MAMETKAIRVLLVDDEPNVRRGLRMQLELEADIAVVGEADDGRTALDQVAAVSPDVVLMDLQMSGVDGLTATSLLRSTRPGTPVVILSLHDGARARSDAARAGAEAFVGKHEPAGVLLAAIRHAASRPPRESEED